MISSFGSHVLVTRLFWIMTSAKIYQPYHRAYSWVTWFPSLLRIPSPFVAAPSTQIFSSFIWVMSPFRCCVLATRLFWVMTSAKIYYPYRTAYSWVTCIPLPLRIPAPFVAASSPQIFSSFIWVMSSFRSVYTKLGCFTSWFAPKFISRIAQLVHGFHVSHCR